MGRKEKILDLMEKHELKAVTNPRSRVFCECGQSICKSGICPDCAFAEDILALVTDGESYRMKPKDILVDDKISRQIAKRMWQQYKDDGYCYAWYTRAEGAIDFEDYLDQQGGE